MDAETTPSQLRQTAPWETIQRGPIRVLNGLGFGDVAQEDYIRGMNTKDSYVRARVDSKLKRDSERILERLGLSTTEAIRLFLVQVRLQKGLPFHVGLNPSAHANDDILLPTGMRQAALDSLHED